MLSTSTAAARLSAVAVAGILAATLIATGEGGVERVAAGPESVADWQKLIHVDGAVDLAGPLADGRMVLAAGGRLFTLGPDGTGRSRFARGPRGYRSEAGEPYVTLGVDVGADAGSCRFRDGQLFALEPRDDPALIRVSRSGRARRFVSLPDDLFLSGIVFDRVGSFGNRLLVTGLRDEKTKTTLFAIDCRGRVETIASGGPRVEGGIEVAPQSFGGFGGRLIAPDEQSGTVYAFDPGGGVTTLVDSGLPAGGDVGVEAVGFVPPGFAGEDRALLADNGVKEKPRVGTDSVLALDAAALAAVGVAPGDLLVATETGAETIRVRCQASCEVAVVASGPAVAHAEGHIIFTGAG